MDIQELLKGGDALDLYMRFVKVLKNDGERVFNAYLTIFKKGDFQNESINLTNKEITAIAERALSQYKYLD